jgi:putative membrane-bound dehydrogenase-like protein
MKLLCSRWVLILPLILWSSFAAAQESAPGLRVPPGFEVTEFADARLANDIYCMTLDLKGRVVVSGRGYIRILVDDNNDGRADRAVDFAQEPKEGAMGLHWEGPNLYFTGDGGLRRLTDNDANDKADGPSQLLRAMKTGGEHSAHDIRRGPDGWLYVLCGNNTGIDKSYAQLPTSPVKDPIAGCVLRFSPDLKSTEIVAHGFRNPYGMDFSLDGDLFTFDSDNERCVSLPWYEPTRFYHVIPGGNYGWLSPQRAQFWRMPPYFLDVVAPVAYLGRGSPTGVACYRQTQFPEEYRDGFFLCDWTFGKVHFAKLDRQGSSYTSKPKVFLESTGDNGFAPTACVVHPTTGDLYVSIGGRGTRGAVYRIRYGKARSASKGPKTLIQGGLNWVPENHDKLLSQATKGNPHERLVALLHLERHGKQLSTKQLFDIITANWDQSDRYIRQVTARLIGGLKNEEVVNLTTWHKVSSVAAQTVALGIYPKDVKAAFTFMDFSLDHGKEKTAEDQLGDLRLFQLLLGDLVAEKAKGTVWEGYTLRREVSPQMKTAIVKRILGFPPQIKVLRPEGVRNVDIEVARMWALLAYKPVRINQDDPIEELHYLIVSTRHAILHPPDPTTSSFKLDYLVSTFLSLDTKFRKSGLKRDTHWPLRVSELYTDLARSNPNLCRETLLHPDFGRPDHVLFTQAPGFDRKRAAEIFLAKTKKDPNYPWTSGIIELLGNLPPEQTRATLEKLWGQAGLDAAILPLLARNPQPADRAKFIDGLASPQLATLKACLDALEKLPGKDDGSETFALLRALGNLPDKQDALRERLGQRLALVTGQKDFGADRQRWLAWFSKTYPKHATRLTNADGVDLGRWQKRLAGLDWAQGDAQRGLKAFHKASCVNCHSGSLALGPDLVGVTQRFGRDDLLTAILQPSRDVPARYQTTLIETNEGKIYQGVIIYDAVDGVILQSGATSTVRIAGGNIAQRRVSPMSLMPAALLDPLSDGEIADLMAYLRSLGKK